MWLFSPVFREIAIARSRQSQSSRCRLRRSVLAALILASAISVAPAAGRQTAEDAGTVFGRVLSTDGAPVAQAKVKLTRTIRRIGADGRLEIVTTAATSLDRYALSNSRGEFSFAVVPPGDYLLVGEAPGYIPGTSQGRWSVGEPAGVLVDAGRNVRTTITLHKAGVVTGRVTDRGGGPLVDVEVHARSVDGNGTYVDRTDDRGEYRIYNLQPGGYHVIVPFRAVSVDDGARDALLGLSSEERYSTLREVGVSLSSRQVTSSGLRLLMPSGGLVPEVSEAGARFKTFATTFYPDQSEPENAELVLVKSGGILHGIDFHLTLSTTHELKGRVEPSSITRPLLLKLVPAVSESALPLALAYPTATAVSKGGGTFRFAAVPEGAYLLTTLSVPQAPQDMSVRSREVNVGGRVVASDIARADIVRAPELPTYWGSTPVRLAPAAIYNLALDVREGFRLVGRVSASSMSRPPTAVSGFSVSLRSDTWEEWGLHVPAETDREGHFSSMQYRPGRYFIEVVPPSPSWTVTSILVEGNDVLRRSLKLSADLSDVLISVSSSPGRLTGSVLPSTRTDDGDIVCLVPTEALRMPESEFKLDSVGLSRLDETRVYGFSGLVPGRYFLLRTSSDSSAHIVRKRCVSQAANVGVSVEVGAGPQATDGPRLR